MKELLDEKFYRSVFKPSRSAKREFCLTGSGSTSYYHSTTIKSVIIEERV
ncbi:MAG: hypothetical protein IH931_02725 [candidate division Zixibacteria bacterium]|nr:hypothetical protein [candidate division Zixibacteria bacterium]